MLFGDTSSLSQIKIIAHGSRNEKKIALTFDACPAHDAVVDWKIIDILTRTQTPTTLFLSGRWIELFPETTRYLGELPQFELANHSFSHPHMTKISEQGVRREIEKNQSLLKNLTGQTATLFRPPYGEYDPRLLRIAQSLGLMTIEYDLPSGDPSPAFTRKILLRNLIQNTRNGSIIVMHMNGRGWHTAEALPEIIQALKEKGFVFVKVSELIQPIGNK